MVEILLKRHTTVINISIDIVLLIFESGAFISALFNSSFGLVVGKDHLLFPPSLCIYSTPQMQVLIGKL